MEGHNRARVDCLGMLLRLVLATAWDHIASTSVFHVTVWLPLFHHPPTICVHGCGKMQFIAYYITQRPRDSTLPRLWVLPHLGEAYLLHQLDLAAASWDVGLARVVCLEKDADCVEAGSAGAACKLRSRCWVRFSSRTLASSSCLALAASICSFSWT